MLRQATRRLLWIVPILIGVTLASFALLSYVPGPPPDPKTIAALGDLAPTELLRMRFLDLPRFFMQKNHLVRWNYATNTAEVLLPKGSM